jgi:bisphosphoglycerate-independent phosphoglycerate mutase (AlkP superfamily)
MGQIKVLDQNMVNNMIAGGEVIERPGGVVKELMENSIDAGATKTAVAIEDGGRKLISVADKGFGMDAEDLDPAFEPHTAHTIGDVPLVVFDERFKSCRLRQGGRLADIGPTLLEMMGPPKPEEMTGQSLLEC